MQKTKFSLYADVTFYSFCALALTFCVLRFYRLSLPLCILCALLVSASVGILSFLFIHGKYKKYVLTKAQAKEKETLSLHLALEQPERVRASLLQAFCADGKEAHCKKEELCVDGNIHAIRFSLEPISADTVAELIRKYGKEFILVCNDATAEAQKLLRSFAIPLLNGQDIYTLYARTNTLPTQMICGNIPRVNAKQRLKRSFSKKNAKPFFVGGLLLLIMSLFVLFPTYYIVTGSVLLLCSVAVRLFGYAYE